VRFYLDENLPYTIAEIARTQGVDVVSSHECGHNGLPDDVQLRLAAEEKRCLVPKDREDLTNLTILFLEMEWPHAGVLIVSQSLPNRNYAAIARALVAYARSHEDDLPAYTLDYLVAERPT
jgi:predicted nuclease of predicted toxin-antitoxin system